MQPASKALITSSKRKQYAASTGKMAIRRQYLRISCCKQYAARGNRPSPNTPGSNTPLELGELRVIVSKQSPFRGSRHKYPSGETKNCLCESRSCGLPAHLTLYVGPKNIILPRMSPKTGEPTGSLEPTNNSPDAREPNVSREIDYPCEFPDCKKTFATKRGRGVHYSKAHRDWHDERAKTEHQKALWSDEETSMMARQEARIVKQGGRFINQALLEFFPHRSVEGIKGKRRNPKYKELVIKYLAEEETQSHVDNNTSELPQASNSITNYIQQLEPLPVNDWEENYINDICFNIRVWDKDRILEELSLYMAKIITTRHKKGSVHPQNRTSTLTRRKKRRIEYAKVQKLWTRSPGLCLRTVLKDAHTENPPPLDLLWSYWTTVMTSKTDINPNLNLNKNDERNTYQQLWEPISPEEIKKAMPANTTSPGPDGLSAKELKQIPLGIIHRIFNIILLIQRIPNKLLESTTTLIPKKEGASKPEDFRPITISSVVTRTLHKVLATRLGKYIKMDERQKAFRKVDGCAENTFLLDLALKYHKASCRHLYLASIDVSKAFDTVSHEAIMIILQASGIPNDMLEYLKFLYSNSKTTLKFGYHLSNKIIPQCGVKQGDPMSPIIFNCIINELIKKIPIEIGVQLPGDRHSNILAFADDIILMASTKAGLQELINISADHLAQCGLKINVNKSHTISLLNVPHEKRSVVDQKSTFTCMNEPLKAVKKTDEWRYLGVQFSPDGRIKVDIKKEIFQQLEKLTKAPLKPQQRLFGLKIMLIPSFYHQLVLGDTRISALKRYDCLIRRYVRKWLDLPHDVPNAYFHATVKDGGLGITSLRWNVPVMRLTRLSSLMKAGESTFLTNEINRIKKNLAGVTNSKLIKDRWRKELYNKVDGKALIESNKTPNQHQWVSDGTRLLSGGDYIHLIKMRINALPVRSRTSRGRRDDKLCRAGCNKIETLNHILQQCNRTHDSRIKRHDAIVTYLKRNLVNSEHKVHLEPRIRTNNGLRKPDIIATKDKVAYVIDAQVVSEHADLTKAHNSKINYYKPLENIIKEEFKVEKVEFTSATLTWRGIWSNLSCQQLLLWGNLKKKEIKLLSTRVLLGGYMAFSTFNKRTSYRRTVRTGIG